MTASWVRLGFVDVFGAANALSIPGDRYEHAVEHGEPFDGSALEGRTRNLESDMLLRPVPNTLVSLSDGTARVTCTVHEPDGSRWSADPRHALEEATRRFDDLAAGLRVGAELELYLATVDGEPADTAGYYDEAGSAGIALVRRVSEMLVHSGVPVEACHHEAGPGQYEIDLGALAPVDLADALVLSKQLARDAARDAGLVATFMPRPFDGEAGSGLHLHQLMPTPVVGVDGRLTEAGAGVVAGQLAHARGLCALAAPTVNSYKRLHAGPEAPGAVMWAHMNRSALVRVNRYGGPSASLEYRGADPSANPYLLLAGLLAAAADGVENGWDPPPPVEEAARGFDPAGIGSVVLEPLPRSLDDALDALLADDALVDAFDDVLLTRLVDGRRAEAEEYRGHVTGWERTRYFADA